MVFFTTPDLLEIGGLPFITPFDKPTRVEALRYYRRVVDAFDLQISFEEKVNTIEREDDVFAVERVRRAACVACGTRRMSFWRLGTTTIRTC